MRIGIVGWGVEGQSAYRYLGPEHEYLIVNEEPRDDFPAESDKVQLKFINAPRQPGTTGNVTDLSYLDGIDNCDKIVFSVANAKNLEKKFGRNKDFWTKTTTVQQLFFQGVKTKNIIGVTGTKGKGTTSTLIFEMLKAAGKKAFLGGNIGKSPLDFIGEVGPTDWVVLELSSFQLYNLTYSPRIGVCLMIAPEHLEWHDDMTDYVEAKANLFRHQNPDDIAIYYENNTYSKRIAGYSPAHKIPYFYKPGAFVRADRKIVVGPNETEVIGLEDIKLLGEHNHQNICAALTALWFGLSDVEDQLKARAADQVLSSFSGLEHRLELVKEVNGIKYYDDSYGTTPESAIVALEAIVQPVILITGGYDRGLSMEPLVDEILKDRVKHVITIGQTGAKIAAALTDNNFKELTTDIKTMPDAVAAASNLAQPGDAVLLSCAAASFDMFPNFKVRGDEFKSAVNKL